MKAFVIDVGICNGCYCCQIVCKDEHVGNDWTHSYGLFISVSHFKNKS